MLLGGSCDKPRHSIFVASAGEGIQKNCLPASPNGDARSEAERKFLANLFHFSAVSGLSEKAEPRVTDSVDSFRDRCRTRQSWEFAQGHTMQLTFEDYAYFNLIYFERDIIFRQRSREGAWEMTTISRFDWCKNYFSVIKT